ncbi:MAG: GNAT family N-acetyltransferase [Gemmataceae bacterium]|nr:GNAT family N-acetyltransferase [Gemmataceae bacterium]MDW8263927.1 GNAT family N-acetyltransferase [Gemmataceae bacterium]
MQTHRVLILHNEPTLPIDHPDADSEHDILYTVEVVSKTLIRAGFEVVRLGTSHDPGTVLEGLKQLKPDVVFNLFEGTADHGNTEAYMAGLLEWLGIPYTGSPFHTLTLARYKHLTKQLLQGAGIPTPEFFVVEQLPVPPCDLEWPVIVKPAMQDASVGLDQGSVVTDQPSLEARVAYLMEQYGPPVLVEKFIRGREFSVALIEAPDLRMLPISEILFVEKDPGYWPIVTYDAKWRPGSRDYEATPPRYPADVSPKLAERIETLARQAYQLVGCRDYARIDFRVRPSGKAYVLEVNPNPCFSPNAGLAGALTSAGLTHEAFTVDLVRAALKRGGKPPSASSAVGRLTRRSPSTAAGTTAREVQVRAAKPGDRESLTNLLNGLKDLPPDDQAEALRSFDAAVSRDQDRDYHGIVAERQGQVAAWACLGRAPRSRVAYQLLSFAVAAPEQGKGIGRRLLQASENWARKAGGRVLIAETVNHSAHAQFRQFLLRQGFRIVGDVPDFFGDGDARLTFAKYL